MSNLYPMRPILLGAATAIVVGLFSEVVHAQQIFSNHYRLRFEPVALNLHNAPLGEKLEVTIPWHLSGQSPPTNFVTHVSLVDEMGGAVASASAPHDPPTSTWIPRRIVSQSLSLTVPRDRPEKRVGRVDSLRIAEGWHWLLVSVRSAKGQTPAGTLILDNPTAQPFESFGARYALGRVYVSSSPVAIHLENFDDGKLWEERSLNVILRNTGSHPERFLARLVLEDETGFIVADHFERMELPPGAVESWIVPTFFDHLGGLTARVELRQDGVLRTQAERRFTVIGPDGLIRTITRGNEVRGKDPRMTTPIHVELSSGPDLSVSRLSARVHYTHASHPPTETRDFRPRSKNTVSAELFPRCVWGYYDVRGSAHADGRPFTFAKRLVAAVFSTKDGRILCNGEPWICKGINVHGLYASRALTEKTMRILRELGFNSIRGDHPVAWQRHLAVDHHLGWVNLPAFSVVHTDKLYARYPGDARATMREISRQACLAGRDDAGTIIWNSANEIGGELDEVLATLYPVYKVYDPYQRPVLYANLFGQDRWDNQDVMGINYYYGWDQPSDARQPMIRRSTEIGLRHGRPVMYTEFNSYWGPVPQSGAWAFRDIFQYGLDIGMSGGTFYQLTDNNRHPGILSPGASLHVRRELAKAARHYFADATVEPINRLANRCHLRIVNKRHFALRSMDVGIRAGGREILTTHLERIGPQASAPIAVDLPTAFENRAVLLQAELRFVTHHAFPCTVVVEVPIDQ